MTTRTAAFNARNDTRAAPKGRIALSSETRLSSDSREDDVESAFSSLSYLLDGDEAPPSLQGAVAGPPSEDVIEVEDGDLIEIDEGWHEAGPTSVTARVIVDPHILEEARRSWVPQLRPRRRDGLTPLMATLTAAASAAPPEVSSGRMVTAMVVATPPARRAPAPSLLPALPPPPVRPLPKVDAPLSVRALNRTAVARVATSQHRLRPGLVWAGAGVSAALVAGVCFLAFFQVQRSRSPAVTAPVAAPAPAVTAPVAAPAPTSVAAPVLPPTPPAAVLPAAEPALPAASVAALAAPPHLRLPGPMPVVEPRKIAARAVEEPPPPAPPAPPASPPVPATVKRTIASTGPVLLDDR